MYITKNPTIPKVVGELDHPFDKDVMLPSSVAKAMASIARPGPANLKKKRQDTLDRWGKRKLELAQREAERKKKLGPEVARVVEPKAIYYFQKCYRALTTTTWQW